MRPALCLAAAAAIGGKELTNFDFGGMNRPRCDFQTTGKPGRRSVAWTGGDRAKIEVPAQIHYRPGGNPQMLLSGDSGLIRVLHFRLILAMR